MKMKVIVGLLSIASAPALAQNPPTPPAAPAAAAASSGPIDGEAALGYISTSGNTDSTNANATFALLYQLDRWGHKFDLSAVAASANDVATAEAYSAKYVGRRQLDETKSYFFTSLDWRSDRFSAYEEELSETAGWGRRFIERGRSVLSAEFGAGARQATLIDGTSEDEAIVRASADYELKFTETTGFTQGLVIESGSSNTSVQAVSALRAQLVGNVGLVLSFRIKSNSSVPPGVVATDRFTSIQLAYSF